ncbi:MAG: hypothetical protein A2X64_04680 [Ignavibacteria bacterium GWF2_33_9]|nr:MAG: hypothetical protein A2X64_04680 [Ignavibacteria bacterium GWF2_33_9]
MKKYFSVVFIILFFFVIYTEKGVSQTNSYTVELARSFSKDIFESNGLPFLQPVVKVVNSTSNAGFFYDARIPRMVIKPYFKFTIQMMYGITPESEKTYSPTMPAEEFNTTTAMSYVDIVNMNIDTAGLIHYLFLNLMYDGIFGSNKGLIDVPESAPTALGNQKTSFELRHSALDTLIKSHPLYPLLQQYNLESTIDSAISNFPNAFDLPPGGNINQIVAGIPQLIVGSYYGTELLLRWVPTMNLGSDIGKFNFWGLGLRHSISQYFDSPLEIAIQSTYQGTKLTNKIGVTNAELVAKANILNMNLHASYNWEKYFTIYSGISFDNIEINSTYKYSLPIVMQWQLGLIDQYAKDDNGNYLSLDEFGTPNNSEPTEGYPGDLYPQTAEVKMNENQMRFTFGISKEFYNFIIGLDYNLGKVPVFGATIGYYF